LMFWPLSIQMEKSNTGHQLTSYFASNENNFVRAA
jgi:hypothetical protein